MAPRQTHLWPKLSKSVILMATLITFKKEQKLLHNSSWETSKKNVRKTTLQIPRPENEVEEVFQVPKQRFPCGTW